MSKAEQDLKIMVVDEDIQRGQALVTVLEQLQFSEVIVATADEYLPDLVDAEQPDLILIDIDAPNRDTIEQIQNVNATTPRPIVMFTQDEDQDTIGAAIRAGVSAYIVDGLNHSKIKPLIDVAILHFQQHQSLRNELEKTKANLEQRRVIEKAKGIIMKQRGLDEENAHQLLRKMAMDRKRKMIEVAKDVIDMAELFNAS